MPTAVPPLELTAVLDRLNALANPQNVAGQQRFGIRPDTRHLGISVKDLRALAKGQRSHELALQLWETGIHEARILASMVDDPKLVTLEQMEHWAAGFDSWDIVDQVCFNLFDRTPYALNQIDAWSRREEEFVRRAAFTLIAGLALHDKKKPDDDFLQFLPLIVQTSTDERNFVKKAVNWALRGIGKRSPYLRKAAVETARRIEQLNSSSARWIARDALRELEPGLEKSEQ